MKRLQRAPTQIFTLSFLDIISCAFAAIVMLVLIAKNGGDETYRGPNEVATQLLALAQSEQQIRALQATIASKQAQLAELQQASATTQTQLDQTNTANQRSNSELAEQAKSIRAITEELRLSQAAINTLSIAEPTSEVGGIPVDAEYVLFIIDTSGSMKQIWSRVIALIEDVLNNHPQIKGFNFMSDNGEYLYNAYAGRWLEDTSRRRNSVLNAIRNNWNASTNSSPVEGLEVALKEYAREPRKMAIYVFGDAYSGSSFDQAIDRISRLNRDPNSGEARMRIHGIGFLNESDHKFATLMRGIATQNRGVFIGLDR
jgi:hypothetical protein